MDSKLWTPKTLNWVPENMTGDELMTISPIEGYRFWYLPAETLFLRSYWMTAAIWLPYQRVEAQCLAHMTCISSGDSCKAGIYAFKDFVTAAACYYEAMEMSIAHSIPENSADKWFVLGKVKLWGNVVEHETGWRAQYGYPSLFYTTSERIQPLAELYGVPTEDRSFSHRPYHPNVSRFDDADHSY